MKVAALRTAISKESAIINAIRDQQWEISDDALLELHNTELERFYSMKTNIVQHLWPHIVNGF
jgi:hypothetical protein